MKRTKEKSNNVLNQKTSLLIVGISLLLSIAYVISCVFFEATIKLQPTSLKELFQNYFYIAIPLIIPSIAIGVSVIFANLRKGGSLLIGTLIALGLSAIIWVLMVTALISLDIAVSPMNQAKLISV